MRVCGRESASVWERECECVGERVRVCGGERECECVRERVRVCVCEIECDCVRDSVWESASV